MRLSYALVAAIATASLLSSGNATVATDGHTTELSAVASPNAVATIDTAVGGEKRSLRYRSSKELEDESDDEALVEDEEDTDDEERRGNNMFSTTKLDEMLDGTQVMSRFKKWKAFGYNTYNLPDAIQASTYDKLRQLYPTETSPNAVATIDTAVGGEKRSVASPNAVATIDTAVGGEKRSLRYRSSKELEDECDDEALVEDEEDTDDEERRGNNMFSTTKLDEMLDGTQVMSRFKKWKAFGYNTYNLPDAIQASTYDKLRQLYRKFLYHN